MIDELTASMSTWKGVVSMKTLRKVTGRLSWLAGVLPRCRWAVSILYAVVASVERDAKSGAEAERAKKRPHDSRDKSGLAPLTRIDLPRQWFLELFKVEEQWRNRKMPLEPSSPQYAIITDASPWGVGMILAAVDKELKEITPLVAIHGLVDEDTAVCLGLPYGEAAGQSTLEAWAVLLALRYWGHMLRGQSVLLRSDSTVALCLAKRLKSSSATLNWVGAEMAAVMEVNNLQDFVIHHLAGRLNVEADFLSRPDKMKKVDPPPGLKDVKVRPLQTAWMLESKLPPPGVDPSVWGKEPQSFMAFDSLWSSWRCEKAGNHKRGQHKWGNR